jgi:hypothetical protein
MKQVLREETQDAAALVVPDRLSCGKGRNCAE